MILGPHSMTMSQVWEADAVGFSGSSKRKFSIAMLLQQKFPSCTSRAEVEVPGKFFSPSSYPGACSWSCVLGTGTSTGLWAWIHPDVLGKRVWGLMRLSTRLKVSNHALNWLDSSSKLLGSLHPVCLQDG